MSQIGQPKRIITSEPVFDPVPSKEQPNETPRFDEVPQEEPTYAGE